MNDICEHCYSTISDTAGIVWIKIQKEHVYCCLCFEGIKPRWFRWCRKYFELKNMAVVLAPYIHYGPPLRHCNPLPVEHADASMA